MKSIVKSMLLLMLAVTSQMTLAACTSPQSGSEEATGKSDARQASTTLAENQATAVFAMGCFWCAEADFEKVDGVIDVVSGYTGGTVENPTYRQVTFSETGHYEAVRVTYDTTKVSYSELLPVFWRNVDPFDASGQFCDKGSSYRAAIFPETEAEIAAAKASKQKWEEHFKRDIATAVNNRATFYLAEDYHQDYYKKNPIRYNLYRSRCGRDSRLSDVWGDVPK